MNRKDRPRFIAANISKKQYLQEQVCGKPSSDGVSAGVSATRCRGKAAFHIFDVNGKELGQILSKTGGLTCPPRCHHAGARMKWLVILQCNSM